MTHEARSNARILAWRLSVGIAALLITASLVYAVLAINLVLFLAGVADFLGRPDAIQWQGIIALFAMIGIGGIVLPIGFIRWAWPRAFPRRTGPAQG